MQKSYPIKHILVTGAGRCTLSGRKADEEQEIDRFVCSGGRSCCLKAFSSQLLSLGSKGIIRFLWAFLIMCLFLQCGSRGCVGESRDGRSDTDEGDIGGVVGP